MAQSVDRFDVLKKKIEDKLKIVEQQGFSDKEWAEEIKGLSQEEIEDSCEYDEVEQTQIQIYNEILELIRDVKSGKVK